MRASIAWLALALPLALGGCPSTPSGMRAPGTAPAAGAGSDWFSNSAKEAEISDNLANPLRLSLPAPVAVALPDAGALGLPADDLRARVERLFAPLQARGDVSKLVYMPATFTGGFSSFDGLRRTAAELGCEAVWRLSAGREVFDDGPAVGWLDSGRRARVKVTLQGVGVGTRTGQYFRPVSESAETPQGVLDPAQPGYYGDLARLTGEAADAAFSRFADGLGKAFTVIRENGAPPASPSPSPSPSPATP